MDGLDGRRSLNNYKDITLQRIVNASPLKEALITGAADALPVGLTLGAVGAGSGAIRGAFQGKAGLGALVSGTSMGGAGFLTYGTYSAIKEYRKIKRLQEKAKRILAERQLENV